LGGVRRGRSFPGWMLLAMVLAMLAGNAGACTLCNTTLSFSVPKAGRATGITVEFRYTHIFEREDTVTVHLPGFTRQAGSTGTSLLSTTTTNALGLSAFSTASWDQEAEILVLSHLLPVVIPADTLLAVTVGAGANIRLPALGVPAAAPSIEIKADTGKPPYNVPFAPFARIPPVGVILNTTLSFAPDLPNYPTGIALDLTPSFPISPGDTISLALTDFAVAGERYFSAAASICTDAFSRFEACSAGTVNGRANPTSSGVKVAFNFSDTVDAFERVRLVIPASVGIKIPIAGSLINNGALTLTSDAVAGPVLAQKIESSEAVSQVALSYAPPRGATGECARHDLQTGECLAWVDEGVDITFALTRTITFEANDTVSLKLPGFSRRRPRQALPQDAASAVECAPNCNLASIALGGLSAATVPRGVWDEATNLLTLVFSGALAFDQLIHVTIPASASIFPPAFGLTTNQANLRYGVQAAAGVQSLATITSSPAVGAFVLAAPGVSEGFRASSSLAYSGKPTASLPLSMLLNFTMTGAVTATGRCLRYCGTTAGQPLVASRNRAVFGAATISLSLPGFSRRGGDLAHFSLTGVGGASESSTFKSGSWIESSTTLVLTASEAALAGSVHTVAVPAALGIRLPSSGVTRNLAALKIETDTAAGPVTPTAIAVSPAIGALSNMSIVFEPRKAGVPVAVTIRVLLNRFIAAREIFRVALPGFTRSPGLASEIPVEATADGTRVQIYADWEEPALGPAGSGPPALNFVVGAGGLATGSLVEVMIPITAEIVSRPAGNPVVAPKRYWRVVMETPVAAAWAVHEINFFQDSACIIPVATHSQGAFSSSPAPPGPPTSCAALQFANETAGCPANTRPAHLAELEACKRFLCSSAMPEYLNVEGDSAHMLGSAYGCTPNAGASPLPGGDFLCASLHPPASNAFDALSETVWLSNGNLTGAMARDAFVGMDFGPGGEVSVRCVSVEQAHANASLAGSAVTVQASLDGAAWIDVLSAPLGMGVQLITSPVLVSSDAYVSPTMESDAIRGPVNPTASAFSTPVGSFGASALTLGTPVAGSVSDITLEVTPAMEIRAGEKITLILPGFSGQDSSSLKVSATFEVPSQDAERRSSFLESVSGSMGPDDEVAPNVTLAMYAAGRNLTLASGPAMVLASWSAATTRAVFTLGTAIYPNTTLTLTILASNAISIPQDGISESACGSGPRVGPLSLLLSNGSAVPCGTCEGCAGTNENEVTLSTDAAMGPVLAHPPTVVSSVQRVGRFLRTAVTYGARTAAVPVPVSLNFTYSRGLAAGDSVRLHLDSFTGVASSNVALEGPGASSLASASWDPALSHLTLTVSDSLAPFANLSITIPASAGVVLPAEGLARDSRLLSLSTTAVAGPVVEPVVIEQSPPMGAFTGEETRVDYLPAEFSSDGSPYFEGRIVSLAVGFSFNRVIRAGEEVSIELFGFSRRDGDLPSLTTFDAQVANLDLNFSTVDTNGVFASFVAASWSEAAHTLTLTASQDVTAEQRHVIAIPAGAAIRLPTVGLVADDPRLLIATNAAAGPNTGTPIQKSPVLNRVCGAECAAWEFSADACQCGSH